MILFLELVNYPQVILECKYAVKEKMRKYVTGDVEISSREKSSEKEKSMKKIFMKVNLCLQYACERCRNLSKNNKVANKVGFFSGKRDRDFFWATIGIFGAGSSFRVVLRAAIGVWLLFRGSFLLLLTGSSFLRRDWALGYRSMETLS